MTEEPPLYHEDVAGYRQPMVTSIGIIMGFLLAFMANWAVSEEEGRVLQDAADWLVAVTILISISLMVVTLAGCSTIGCAKTSVGATTRPIGSTSPP